MADRTSDDPSRLVSSGFPRPEDVPGPTERLRELHEGEDTEAREPKYGRASVEKAGSEDHVRVEDMISTTGRTAEAAADSLTTLANRVAEKTVEKMRAEMSARDFGGKAKQAGVGIGELGASGALGLAAVGALVTAVVVLLARVLPLWAAGLVAAALFGGPAAALAMAGQRNIRKPLGLTDA